MECSCARGLTASSRATQPEATRIDVRRQDTYCGTGLQGIWQRRGSSKMGRGCGLSQAPGAAVSDLSYRWWINPAPGGRSGETWEGRTIADDFPKDRYWGDSRYLGHCLAGRSAPNGDSDGS